MARTITTEAGIAVVTIMVVATDEATTITEGATTKTMEETEVTERSTTEVSSNNNKTNNNVEWWNSRNAILFQDNNAPLLRSRFLVKIAQVAVNKSVNQ